MEAKEEAAVEVMETIVLLLILSVGEAAAVVAEVEEGCKNLKFPAKNRPRLTITILDLSGFTKFFFGEKQKQKKIIILI